MHNVGKKARAGLAALIVSASVLGAVVATGPSNGTQRIAMPGGERIGMPGGESTIDRINMPGGESVSLQRIGMPGGESTIDRINIPGGE